MASEKEKPEKQYNADRDEAIKLLLQSSLVYALKIHNFDAEKYFIEDVTSVLADCQTLILKAIDELIEGSFAVMKEFVEKYTAR